MKKENDGKFEKIFYSLIIILLIISAIFFIFLRFKLKESFFIKYSEDKKLEQSTIQKINQLRIIVLCAEVSALMLIFLIIYFKNSVKSLIQKHKSIIQNLLLLFGVLIILFLISEITLRIMFYDKSTNNGFGPPSLKFKSNYYHLNKEGFRDAEFNLEKPENTARIIGLGDSYAFGWGIKNVNDTYFKILEKKLDEKGNYEVMNFAVPGAYTDNELKVLKEKTLGYEPDMMIIAYMPNDIKNVDENIKDYKWKEIKIPFNFWMRNSLYTFYFAEVQYNIIIGNFGKKSSYLTYVAESFNSEINKEYNRNIFKEIKEVADENNIKVMIVIFPMLYGVKDDYKFLNIHEFVKETAKENNFYFLDLLPVYSKYEDSDLIVNKYDRHPNEFAHRLAAEASLSKINEENIISKEL